MGAKVRYDGGHKRSPFLTDILDPIVEWIPICPEVELGLGTPRPAMRLCKEGSGGEVRMLEIDSGQDHGPAMRRFAAKRVRSLGGLDLSGYVLKKDSPSCGMERVKVYGSGMPKRAGRGLFAEALLEAHPNLPIEEEGRLNDPRLRENFIGRIFAFRRLKALFRGRWSRGQVVAFHTAHKLQLCAHAPALYRELGRRVADVKQTPRAEFREDYCRLFMEALARIASRGRNTDVLQHAAGHLKTLLDSESRAELAELIHDYRTGLVPLVVPSTLLRHHVRVHRSAYLQGQTFLEPHPKELMLRNHV